MNTNSSVFADSELSPLDKAYMTINYPFPTGAPVLTHWSLSVAMDVAGVPAKLAAEITVLANDPAFDVSQIRTKFAQWTQEAHQTTHKEMALSPSITHPAHGLPHARRINEDREILSRPIASRSDCAASSPPSQSMISGAQHAVAAVQSLWELPEVSDHIDYNPKVELNYRVIDSVPPATPYQLNVLEMAMGAWESCCCVRFVEVTEGYDPPLRILIKPGKPDDEERSHTLLGTGARGVRSPDPTVTLYLFENENEAEAWDNEKNHDIWPLGEECNRRTCLHEVCRYAYFISNVIANHLYSLDMSSAFFMSIMEPLSLWMRPTNMTICLRIGA